MKNPKFRSQFPWTEATPVRGDSFRKDSFLYFLFLLRIQANLNGIFYTDARSHQPIYMSWELCQIIAHIIYPNKNPKTIGDDAEEKNIDSHWVVNNNNFSVHIKVGFYSILECPIRSLFSNGPILLPFSFVSYYLYICVTQHTLLWASFLYFLDGTFMGYPLIYHYYGRFWLSREQTMSNICKIAIANLHQYFSSLGRCSLYYNVAIVSCNANKKSWLGCLYKKACLFTFVMTNLQKIWDSHRIK